MHIPDGFLSMTTVATTCVVSAGGVANAVRIANKKLGEKQVPLMGVMAAFIFAAQMLNFPVAGGTPGILPEPPWLQSCWDHGRVCSS